MEKPDAWRAEAAARVAQVLGVTAPPSKNDDALPTPARQRTKGFAPPFS
ncbi:hypothetical protein [Frateuria soli]|nr:hypothetical protein [Frateuria soli]UGB37214.1 hypothetical protein LQ771_10245 [Frateuria soli]